MLNISIFLNLVLLIVGIFIGNYYYQQSEQYKFEIIELENIVGTLQSKIARIQKKQYTVYGAPKATFKEETLFNQQYTTPNECLAQDEMSNWVKCVDMRKKALDNWLKQYRKNI